MFSKEFDVVGLRSTPLILYLDGLPEEYGRFVCQFTGWPIWYRWSLEGHGTFCCRQACYFFLLWKSYGGEDNEEAKASNTLLNHYFSGCTPSSKLYHYKDFKSFGGKLTPGKFFRAATQDDPSGVPSDPFIDPTTGTPRYRASRPEPRHQLCDARSGGREDSEQPP